MAIFRTAVVLLALASSAPTVASEEPRPDLATWKEGQAAIAANGTAAAAKQAKFAAVDKVVQLLESLQTQILKEGEEEAASYNKFACFCKDTTAEKLEAIQKGEDSKASLVADIQELSSKRDGLDKTIQDKQDAIAAHQKAIEDATAAREKENKLYQDNAADLKAALDALDGAIKSLKASKSPSMLQLQGVSQTVRSALLLADALGVGKAATKRAVAALLQQPANDVQMEDYKFHSQDVIDTMEKLQKDFIAERNSVDAAEVNATAAFDSFRQQETNQIKNETLQLETAQKQKSATIAEIETDSEDLTVVEKTLMDDKQYTNELSDMCRDTAKTWDQRSKLRADELSTLTQAMGIIKGAVSGNTSAATIRFMQQGVGVRVAKSIARDPAAMDAIEAEAESAEAGLAFFQKQQASRSGLLLAKARRHRGGAPGDGRDAVAQLLKSEGEHLKSTLLTSLASRIGADPLAKVKQLIQELIERLLQEAANEANQKGWCDKSTQAATQKKDYAAEEVRALNGELAKLEATKDELREELQVVAQEIDQLNVSRATATQLRHEEQAENNATIHEAQQGLDALNMCIELLEKFYKTSTKAKVELGFAQQGPATDAPSTGFKIGEAYLGAQSESGGILGMLDVMKSDFVRTIEQTQADEAKQRQEYYDFMTESGKSLAMKEQSQTEWNTQLDNTLEAETEAHDNLDSQTEILTTAITELLDLKKACIDTGMTYEDRVARREEEIAALNKALCILENYAEYGPEGAAGKC